MNYGFLIDNSACIGCHACSTACKSENQVPVGVHRTWVKVTEAGTFPDVRRAFQVTRCNHCANPPCVRICPTGAMHQRPDGIVQFDSDACIGCKGCLQACPYDSIHIDPDTKTAAKCHFCAHRVDVGLEPACVVVCPEHAIIAGDLDDPESEISRRLAKHNTTVRKPEQGTAPNLFYIEGNELSLHPTALDTPEMFMWSDVHDGHGHPGRPEVPHPRLSAQGLPADGPIVIGERVASHMAQVGWNAQHRIPWHWQIPAYLVTKHVAAGIFLFASLVTLWPGLSVGRWEMVGTGVISMAMMLVTLILLIADLERPDRFFYLLLRPQWRSWIARAAWILTAFSGLSAAWWGVELVGLGIGPIRTALALVTLPVAWLAATYTAFLFAQAEGRDLWQGNHLPIQMTAQALYLGAAPFAVVGGLTAQARVTMAVALAVSGLITLGADVFIPHASEQARRAAWQMTRGRYRIRYWVGGIILGHAVPLLLLATNSAPGAALAFPCAAVGLYLYATAFVTAPQEIPNS